MLKMSCIKLFFACCAVIVLFMTFTAFENSVVITAEADELTDSCVIEYESEKTVISSDSEIFGIYIEWRNLPGEWCIEAEDAVGQTISYSCGKERFFHEFITVSGYRLNLIVSDFKRNVLNFRVFGKGDLPSDVQVWNAPCKEADLMLLSTHSDDEHLFFAGILPYYAGELKMNVQVVYMVDHSLNSESRPHELLNGLWNVGVRNYPVIGEVPDLYSESLDDAYAGFLAEGYDKAFFEEFVTENIRRFKPLVVVGHDIEGEYGHGAHRVYTDALIAAAELCDDVNYHTASADKYGTWQVPKIYLHLYDENQIVMDWDDKLLDSFGGRSAFQVSVEEGFSQHKSQHYTWFSKWCGFYDDWGIKSAKDIETLDSSKMYMLKDGGLSPRRFGLYSSHVGEDKAKNDFFENIDKYSYRETEKPSETPVVSSTPLPTETFTPNDGKENECPASTELSNESEDFEPKQNEGKTPALVLLSVIYATAVVFLAFLFFKFFIKK